MSKNNIAFKPGQHLCHLYRDFNEQKRIALPFIKEGLERGEYCCYITGELPVDDWYLELQAYGVDVHRALDRGALDVITFVDYRNPGNFNSISQARRLVTLAHEKLNNFAGVRLAGEGSWETEPTLAADQLTHWEATADLVCDSSMIFVCQYDVSRYSPQTVRGALRTHPIVVLDGTWRRNPYYEASEILEREPHLNNSDADAASVREMLQTLGSAPEER